MNTSLAQQQSFENNNTDKGLKLAFKRKHLYQELVNGDASMAVIGLGYVGLPLAVHMASRFKVTGFDISKEKVLQMLNHQDPCNELPSEAFENKSIQFSFNDSAIAEAKMYIVAVPTPIDQYKTPNLEPLKAATATVAKYLKEGDCVVFESTVFPGCTDEVCIPILERISRLKLNKDFTVGYSPERINPGDKQHTFTKIKKIVSGSNEAALELIADVYSTVVEAGVHKAESIKVAEAAKVVENIQRDVNIGLMNELSQIFNALDINTKEVLKAAGTKWNFHNYFPGLVGGHCIGVDPYYLIQRAKRFNIKPHILETVRKTNEGMVNFIIKKITTRLWKKQVGPPYSILVKGITFKEDVNDIRNSKVACIVKGLQRLGYGYNITVEDPYADKDEVKQHYGIDLSTTVDPNKKYDVIIMAVNHTVYQGIESLEGQLNDLGFVFDIRGTFKHLIAEDRYLTL